jgi:hypothetical protein
MSPACTHGRDPFRGDVILFSFKVDRTVEIVMVYHNRGSFDLLSEYVLEVIFIYFKLILPFYI